MNAVVKFIIISTVVLAALNIIAVLIPDSITSQISSSISSMISNIYALDNVIPAQPIIDSLKILAGAIAGLATFVVIIWLYEIYQD